MAIVKFNAINQAETAMIKKYLGFGLELDINAMSGTQGEKGKVALADNDNVYLIYVDRGSSDDDLFRSHAVTRLIVEKQTRDRRDMKDDWHTYWLHKGEIIEQIEYHQLPGSNEDAYTTDIEEWQAIHDKNWSRYENRHPRCDSWKKVNYDLATIIEIVKNRTGRKRVAQENIIEVEKRYYENRWRISVMFNGKKSSIVIGID